MHSYPILLSHPSTYTVRCILRTIIYTPGEKYREFDPSRSCNPYEKAVYKLRLSLSCEQPISTSISRIYYPLALGDSCYIQTTPHSLHCFSHSWNRTDGRAYIPADFLINLTAGDSLTVVQASQAVSELLTRCCWATGKAVARMPHSIVISIPYVHYIAIIYSRATV